VAFLAVAAALVAAALRGAGSMSVLGHDLSSAERSKVTLAIKKAELQTSGEIVVVAARESDDYIHVPIHIAAACALVVPFLMPLFARFFPWSSISTAWVFAAQLITFIIVALVLSLPRLRYLITPNRLMRKYAHRNAATQFLAVNTHGTGGRTGVLIFVSLLERYVEVIGDTAIAQKVSQGDWQKIVDEMLPLLRNHQTTDALVLGVESCGKILAKHFPAGSENPNELPDHFIVLN
jgi:putative membrane protein